MRHLQNGGAEKEISLFLLSELELDVGYSLSGVWSELQVMGVAPSSLKFYFFFFFHLPPGVLLCFLTSGVTSRALTSRAVLKLLPQYVLTLGHHAFLCIPCFPLYPSFS